MEKSENDHAAISDFADQAITLDEQLTHRVVRNLRDNPSSSGKSA
jgi:hypothetical protein